MSQSVVKWTAIKWADISAQGCEWWPAKKKSYKQNQSVHTQHKQKEKPHVRSRAKHLRIMICIPWTVAKYRTLCKGTKRQGWMTSIKTAGLKSTSVQDLFLACDRSREIRHFLS